MRHIIIEFLLVCKLLKSEFTEFPELSELGEETIRQSHVCSVIGRSELKSIRVEIVSNKEVETTNPAPKVLEHGLPVEKRFHATNQIFFNLISVFKHTDQW